MSVIGPEVTALQLRGAKANVNLVPSATTDHGNRVVKNKNAPNDKETPKAPLLPATQVSFMDWLRGWVSPPRVVQSNQLPDPRGLEPSWLFVASPGYERPSHYVYDTFAIVPKDIGGSMPVDFLRSVSQPMIQDFAMRMQGVPVTGGNILLRGLYTPSPIVAPDNP